MLTWQSPAPACPFLGDSACVSNSRACRPSAHFLPTLVVNDQLRLLFALPCLAASFSSAGGALQGLRAELRARTQEMRRALSLARNVGHGGKRGLAGRQGCDGQRGQKQQTAGARGQGG